MTKRDDDIECVFCGKPAGPDFVSDDHDEVACRPCGEAEIATQIKEGFIKPRTPSDSAPPAAAGDGQS